MDSGFHDIRTSKDLTATDASLAQALAERDAAISALETRIAALEAGIDTSVTALPPTGA